MSEPRTLVLAVSDAVTADAFLRGHLRAARDAGWHTVLVGSESPILHEVASDCGAEAWPVELSRRIDPLRDLAALVAAVRMLRRQRPDASHVGTPKAGLVIGLAARLAGVPRRVYTLHGLRLDTVTGARRAILWVAEWLACRAATHVVAVSPSLKRRAVDLRIVPGDKVRVFGSGSISGVDPLHFAPMDAGAVTAWRSSHGLSEDALCVIYVGRLAGDKGLGGLAAAWPSIRAGSPTARLVVVGATDASDPVPPPVLEALEEDPSVVLLGALADPAPAYASCDLLVLPTLREGFGLVVLEAAACGVPAVATDVVGCVDAVVDGVTGVLVPPGDPESLARAVSRLLADDEPRRRMGTLARERAVRDFDPERLETSYLDLLSGP